MKLRKGKKFLTVFLGMLLCLALAAPPVSAYFDRGTVGLSLGQSSVTLSPGSSTSVSARFSPSSSSQLPGCGMPECPQSCGEKECLDANGECTCNGKVYETYYAYATVSSSNTSVATALYSNGVVTINGVSAGTATITVTSALRQFTGTSKTISVTVNAPTSSESASKPETSTGTSGSSTAEAGASSGGKSSGTEEKPVTASKVAGKEETEAEEQKTGETETGTATAEQEKYTMLESDRGTIMLVPAVDAKTVGSVLEQVKGQSVFVDFQSKDDAETIRYAWELNGEDITDTRETDLSVGVGQTPFTGCEFGRDGSAVYLSFSDKSVLPASASLYLRVSDYYENGTLLHLYIWENGTVHTVDDNLTVENGYVTMNLTERSNLILSTEEYKEIEEQQPEAVSDAAEPTDADKAEQEAEPIQTEAATDDADAPKIGLVIGIAAAVAAVGCAAGVILHRRKKQ